MAISNFEILSSAVRGYLSVPVTAPVRLFLRQDLLLKSRVWGLVCHCLDDLRIYLWEFVCVRSGRVTPAFMHLARVARTLGEASRRGSTRALKGRYPGTPRGVRLLIDEWCLVGGRGWRGKTRGVVRGSSCSCAAEGGSSAALRNPVRLPP